MAKYFYDKNQKVDFFVFNMVQKYLLKTTYIIE